MVAHRGASDVSPEHTLAAYHRAIDAGADGLECDVRLTADGHLVCVHDRRIERTSNGRGVLSTMSLEELEKFDWGSWKSPWAELDDEAETARSRHAQGAHTRQAARDRAGRGPAGRAGDRDQAPDPVRRTGRAAPDRGPGPLRLGASEGRHGVPGPGDELLLAVLRRMRELAPGLRTVLLMDRVPLRFRDGSLPTGVSYAGPSLEIVTAHPEYVDRAHKHGHQVHVWTVNAEQDVRHCREIGVDAVISDRPEAALQDPRRTAKPRFRSSRTAPATRSRRQSRQR